MSDAWIYLLRCDPVESVFNLFFFIEVFVVCQLIKSLTLVDSFHLTEHRLDRVIVRGVSQIENRTEV